VDRSEPVDRWNLVHVDVQHVQERIEAPAVPFGPSQVTGGGDRAL
jgi:hypothetical protein